MKRVLFGVTAAALAAACSNSTEPAAPKIAAAPVSWVYPRTQINHVSSAKVFTVRNIGGAPTTSFSALFTGTNKTDFTITDNACVTVGVVAPGANCTISVEFTPVTDAFTTMNASLYVQANPGPSTVLIPLSGDVP